MKGTCQKLCQHPERIERKILRYMDMTDQEYPVYEVYVPELCKALCEYDNTREVFCEKCRIDEKDYTALMNLIQGKKLKDLRKFRTYDSALNCFLRFAEVLGNSTFLSKKIPSLEIRKILNEIRNNPEYQNNLINAVYQDIIRLCSILAESCFYHEAGTAQGTQKYIYILDEIRNKIWLYSLYQDEIREKLFRILDETQLMIISCDIPNVAERWLAANPCLKYYDAVFEIYHQSPEYYNKIINSKNIHFRFLPTEEEFKLEEEYRLKQKKRQEIMNISYEKQYQEEVIKAVAAIFKTDFSVR